MRFFLLGLALLALASCGEPASAPEQPAVAPAAAVADDEAGAPRAFTAFGTDWRAVVDGTSMTLEGPLVGEHRLDVEAAAYARGIDFAGPDGLNLSIKGEPCRDDNGSHDMTAELSFRGKVYPGCATSGATARAPT